MSDWQIVCRAVFECFLLDFELFLALDMQKQVSG